MHKERRSHIAGALPCFLLAATECNLEQQRTQRICCKYSTWTTDFREFLCAHFLTLFFCFIKTLFFSYSTALCLKGQLRAQVNSNQFVICLSTLPQPNLNLAFEVHRFLKLINYLNQLFFCLQYVIQPISITAWCYCSALLTKIRTCLLIYLSIYRSLSPLHMIKNIFNHVSDK